MAATRQALRVLAQARREMSRLMAPGEREAVRAWATAWSTLADELEAALLSGSQRAVRLQASLKMLTETLQTLTANAGLAGGTTLGAIVASSVAATEALVRAQMPRRWPMRDRVDPAQLRAITERSAQRITSLHRPIAQQTARAIGQELVRGVAEGLNPRETARLIMRNAQDHFNLSLNRSLVITRTEQLDCYRAAGQATMLAHDGVLAGWQWVASLTARTCPSCIAQHGTLHSLSEPGPLDHPCGRCARLPVTRSWRGMGFDQDEPDDALPDKHAFWDGLSDADQKHVLGPSRYTAYKRGEYPMDRWSARRKNPGWRDSYQVSKLPISE